MIKTIIILALVYLIVSRLSAFRSESAPNTPPASKPEPKNNMEGEYVDYEEVD